MTGWLKLKLMGLITFINAAIGVTLGDRKSTLGGLLYTIWPDHYFKWYPSIPIFYWVMAIVMTYILDRKKRKNGDVTITAFMVVRFCKFTLAVVFLWLYAALVRENLRMFGFTLMLFYLFGIGNVYGLSVREEKNEKREKGK